ncbi:hypothetical protein ABB34_10820 [Stenotrophomonas daejeonensis]|uniref:Uncharacterized protein n=1 Tax=Stenotrophomonas daejeonensis TaxID=659018 RepID=A0A0R0DPP1_9GAMM|nr:hypothetical protein ABB34_10820 [Stenotrophomonas daejeonensis]
MARHCNRSRRRRLEPAGAGSPRSRRERKSRQRRLSALPVDGPRDGGRGRRFPVQGLPAAPGRRSSAALSCAGGR